jgi:hypothetical protein
VISIGEGVDEIRPKTLKPGEKGLLAGDGVEEEGKKGKTGDFMHIKPPLSLDRCWARVAARTAAKQALSAATSSSEVSRGCWRHASSVRATST